MAAAYGEHARTSTVDQYSSSSTIRDKILEMEQEGRSPLDDASVSTSTRNFRTKLGQLSSFRQLSQAERQKLLSDVQNLLGEESHGVACGGVRRQDESHDHDHKEEESQSRASSLDTYGASTSCFTADTRTMFTNEDKSEFTNADTRTIYTADTWTMCTGDTGALTTENRTPNEDQTQLTTHDRTMFSTTDDQTQFTLDSQSLLSLIDTAFSRKTTLERGGGRGWRTVKEDPPDDSGEYSYHCGGGDYDECGDAAENGMLSMCDTFLSCIMCDGKSEAVEIEASERRDRRTWDKKRNARKGRWREGNERRRRARRQTSFVIGKNDSDLDSSNCGDSNDEFLLQDQSSMVERRRKSTDETDPPGEIASICMEVDLLATDNHVHVSTNVEETTSGRNVELQIDGVDVKNNGVNRESDVDDVDIFNINHVPTKTTNLSPNSVISSSSVCAHQNEACARPMDCKVAKVPAITTSSQRTKSCFKSFFTRSKPSVSKRKITKSNEVHTGVMQHDGATISSDRSSGGTNNNGSSGESIKIESTSSGIQITRKKKTVWKEYTDVTSGMNYYSNGVITTWERPVNVDIFVLPSISKRETASTSLSSTSTSIEKLYYQQQQQQTRPLAEVRQSKSPRERNNFMSFLRRTKS